MSKKVSVIIPAYNQEKYLSEALNSACNQTYMNVEVIVVNDGSSDGTEALVREASKKYRNLIYIYQENQGLASTRNNGIKASSGDYLAFLDSDDFWTINRLEVWVTNRNGTPENARDVVALMDFITKKMSKIAKENYFSYGN